MAFRSFRIQPKRVNEDPSQTYELSSEQIQFYEENGYLVIKKLIDLPALESYRQRFRDVCDGKVSRNLLTVVKDLSLFDKNSKPETYINKIQDILYDEVFSTYSENPRLLHVISQIIGQDLSVINGMLINKPPGTNTHYPHQDLLYFPFRPAQQILASWTAIDPVTEENGCLFMIPGSHKSWELLEHNHMVDDGKPFFFSIANCETMAPDHKRVRLILDPGDTVFISSTIIHGSMPNLSNTYRKAITCHYVNSNCHFFDVTGSNQEKLANMVEKHLRRQNYDFKFMDLWKMKLKTVRGFKSNL
ncbi:unnamed protein product [Arctia plantaginis]|uniref:phytanoyl-CoA dioxygenase n=1 Tax=Arctia plantaginis TaxID=874455 RepID=A0A8S0Z187_ARCPL|nr:unnamed protein product [Arctia plantaginis]